ncbi:MAG TPA: hypothetical protein DD719_03275 [Desulfotomaculum sp.]|nr:hypothetical protein [Desulfotomaculum sp.]
MKISLPEEMQNVQINNLTRFGLVEDLQVARDRNGEFESRVLPRYQRREEKIDRQLPLSGKKI